MLTYIIYNELVSDMIDKIYDYGLPIEYKLSVFAEFTIFIPLLLVCLVLDIIAIPFYLLSILLLVIIKKIRKNKE